MPQESIARPDRVDVFEFYQRTLSQLRIVQAGCDAFLESQDEEGDDRAAGSAPKGSGGPILPVSKMDMEGLMRLCHQVEVTVKECQAQIAALENRK